MNLKSAGAIPRPVQRLIDQFSRLPGIGPKSASRLTFYLLRAADEQASTLAEALVSLKSDTSFCSICYNIRSSEVDPCAVCSDVGRDTTTLCVVEEPLDVFAIERAGIFKGIYHVLHGSISPVDGIGPDDLKLDELLERVNSDSVKEVVIATNPNLSGEATAMYIYQRLSSGGARVTRLARGLPVGGDLEYADEITLMRSLEGRQDM